jgi:hypothetical protein
MKAAFGILLAGGGLFLLVMLFNGTLSSPLGFIGGDTKTGGVFAGTPFQGAFGTTPPQTSNSNAPGYVPPINSKCPKGKVWNTKTGACI